MVFGFKKKMGSKVIGSLTSAIKSERSNDARGMIKYLGEAVESRLSETSDKKTGHKKAGDFLYEIGKKVEAAGGPPYAVKQTLRRAFGHYKEADEL